MQRQPTAKRLLRWALIGIAIVVAAVLALGNNVGYAKPAHAASVRTIAVVEHAITDTEIPTGGGADVKGNILTFNNPSTTRPTSRRSATTRASARGSSPSSTSGSASGRRS